MHTLVWVERQGVLLPSFRCSMPRSIKINEKSVSVSGGTVDRRITAASLSDERFGILQRRIVTFSPLNLIDLIESLVTYSWSSWVRSSPSREYSGSLLPLSCPFPRLNPSASTGYTSQCWVCNPSPNAEEQDHHARTFSLLTPSTHHNRRKKQWEGLWMSSWVTFPTTTIPFSSRQSGY